MASASASIELSVSAELVWQLIGGFDSLPDWLPYIPQSRLGEGGRLRFLANPNGDEIVERLVAFDEAARCYAWVMLKAPFPVRAYHAALQVHEQGAGCRVAWSGSFEPDGVSAGAATRLFQGLYENGLAALAGRFAAAGRNGG